MTTKTKKKTQTELVLDHLERHGYITDLIARNYRVQRIAARIYDLKVAGVPIEAETRRDDTGVKYAYYTLAA